MSGLMGSTVAVTGGRGIVGRRFCEFGAHFSLDIRCFTGDINSAEQISAFLASVRPTIVIHLAALVELASLVDQECGVLTTNVGGTLNICKSLKAAGLKPFLFFASSSHVYGESLLPIRETDIISPRNFYGLSKQLGEDVISFYAKEMGLEACIGRIFSLYDERQLGKFLLPATRLRLENASLGDVISIRNGNSVRDFSHATEIAEYIWYLVKARQTGVFNIGSGRGQTLVSFLSAFFGADHSFVAMEGGTVDRVVADVAKLKGI